MAAPATGRCRTACPPVGRCTGSSCETRRDGGAVEHRYGHPWRSLVGAVRGPHLHDPGVVNGGSGEETLVCQAEVRFEPVIEVGQQLAVPVEHPRIDDGFESAADPAI